MQLAKRRLFTHTTHSRDLESKESLFFQAMWILNCVMVLGLGVLGGMVLTEKPTGNLNARALLIFLISGAVFNLLFSTLAWRRRRLRLELQSKIEQDPLTGAMTHSHFEEILNEEIRRAGRYRYPLVLSRADLDGFRSFNQQFGTEKADYLLKEFSDHLRASVRFTDIVARYQNDEFCILMPHTNLLGAQKTVSRLLDSVEELTGATFSAGVAVYQAGETAASFLMRAGTALAHAQKTGKGRVHCLAGGEDSSSVVRL